MNYLLAEVLDGMPTYEFSDKHKFVRDRTRSIRQDIVVQQRAIENNPAWLAIVVALHEQIARFHIMSGHRLCALEFAEFDPFQNTEQLRKVLQSLQEYYKDIRTGSYEASFKSETLGNEAEFRLYQILTHAEDQDIFRQALAFPSHVFASMPVQFALACVSALHQRDYVRFSRLVLEAPYLPACLLHAHLRRLRKDALQVISKAYVSSRELLPAHCLSRWLLVESPEELVNIVETVGWKARKEAGLAMILVGGEAEEMNLKPLPCQLIEQKVVSRSISSIILDPLTPSSGSGFSLDGAVNNNVPSYAVNRVPSLSRPFVDTKKTRERISSLILDNLLSWICQSESSSISTNAIVQEKNRRQRIKANTLQKVSLLAYQRLFAEILLEMLTDFVTMKITRNKQIVYRNQIIDSFANRLVDGLLSEMVKTQCRAIIKAMLSRSLSPASSMVIGNDEGLSLDESLCASSSEPATPRSKIPRQRRSFISTPLQRTPHRTIDEAVLGGGPSFKARLEALARGTSAERLEAKKFNDLLEKALNS